MNGNRISYKENPTAPQGSFQEQLNPYLWFIWFHCRVYSVVGRRSDAKGTGKKDTLAAAITEQTQERGWAGCIVHWGWGQGSAGWAQAGHSGLAPPHPSSLPTAVNLTWRSLTFTELERPETNGGEENRMGSEVHRVWLPRYILSAKWSTLWVPFKTLWYSTQGPYFVLNQNNRLP